MCSSSPAVCVLQEALELLLTAASEPDGGAEAAEALREWIGVQEPQYEDLEALCSLPPHQMTAVSRVALVRVVAEALLVLRIRAVK